MNADAWAIAPDGTPGSALSQCLDAAAAAPSIHNTQPWRFRVRGRRVDVFVDRSRRLDVIDPGGRELLISVGAAVLNLRVAMLAHGRKPILRLLPSAEEPDLVAAVIGGPPVQPDQTVKALNRAIPRRHTNRRPFADIAIPDEVLEELAVAARAEGADVYTAEAPTRRALLSMIRNAEHRRNGELAYRQELAEWTTDAPGRRDGVPPQAFGPHSALDALPIRDFGLLETERVRPAVDFESEPTIAVLYTVGDGPVAWLRAGQALQRVLLTATVRGLCASPLTQALEYPELRDLLADPTDGRRAQVILRFGYGPPSAPAPRRPVRDLLIDRQPAPRKGSRL
jgi:nitroreductase